MKKSFCLFYILFSVSGCYTVFTKHTSDYIFITKPIDVNKDIKKGKTCSTSPQTNKEMIFETAKKVGIKNQILFIEKTEEGGQYCTVVYGDW